MNTARAVFLALAFSAAAIPAFAAAPTWDSTGNPQLNGAYYFRQVLYESDSSGNLIAAYTFYGNVTFSGNGTYSITNATFLEYTSSSGASSTTNNTGSGTYSLSSSGFGQMASPLVTGANLEFLVSNNIVIGSDTESGYNDLFIAAPVASTALTNASFSGSYTISSFFIGNSLASDATYQLNPNGSGSIGSVSITGNSGSGTSLTQNSSGVKYNFSNGANVITFPTNSSATFYSGQLYMYMSPDTNFVFGGTPGGFDMFVGVKNAGSGASTPLSNGLYYEAGLDANLDVGIDSYYGSLNAYAGNIIGHERIAYSNSGAANGRGETYYSTYPTTISNTYTDPSGSMNYTIGQDGIRIGYGVIATSGANIGAFPAIAVAMPYTPPGASGSVYLDPSGIVNSASSAPYTAGVSPGDFISIYNGVNLASTTAAAPPGAFPTTLGGVEVLIDGYIQAPIQYVSPTEISFVVPYEVTTNNYTVASIQVVNNNVRSNVATTYVYQTTPGVFTANPVGGYGVAAMEDFPSSGGYFIVSAGQPANPGDPIALFLTGLGTPFPSNPDGALGPALGDTLANDVRIYIGGVGVGNLAYSGLAPDLAGLYQVNFTMPTLCGSPAVQPCINSGVNSVGVAGVVVNGSATLFDSYSDESIIPVGTGGTTASVRAPAEGSEPALDHPAAPRLRQRPQTAAQAQQTATE